MLNKLIISFLTVVIIFGGTLYLVTHTTPLGANEMPVKDYSIQLEAIIERDENRETRAILRKEIEEKVTRIHELEKRADELNEIINPVDAFQ